MRTVVIAKILVGLGCLAMMGYGFVILLISQMDALRPDHFGIVLGCALLCTFLVVPALSIVRSIKLATIDRRASMTFALAPFATSAVAVLVMRTIPWPSPPQRIGHCPETPATYFWRLARCPF